MEVAEEYSTRFDKQFASQAISAFERLQLASTKMSAEASSTMHYNFTPRATPTTSPPSSPEAPHHHRHRHVGRGWSASMPSSAAHSEDEHGHDDCHSDHSCECPHSDNETENNTPSQSRCTSPSLSFASGQPLLADLRERLAEKAAKRKPCLRQYKCVYPGCSSWRTNKRNNMERHVWTQHVRATIDSADVPYIARLHKHFVSKHLVPVTPAIRGPGRVKTPKTTPKVERKCSSLRSSRLSSQADLTAVHEFSFPLVASDTTLSQPPSSQSWPVSPEHFVFAPKQEDEQPARHHTFVNPYAAEIQSCTWHRRGFLNVQEPQSLPASSASSPNNPFGAFNVRVSSPVHHSHDTAAPVVQNAPVMAFAPTFQAALDTTRTVQHQASTCWAIPEAESTECVWRPWD